MSFRHVHSFKSSLSSESSSNSAPLQVAPRAADYVTFSDGKKTYRERWQPQNSQSAPKWRKTFQSHRSARRVNGSTLIGSRRRTKWRRGAAILGVQWRIVEQHVTFGHRLRTRHELRKPTLVINCHLDYKLDEIPTIFTTKWPTFRVDVVCLFSQSQTVSTAKIFSRRHNFRRRMDHFVVKIFNWWQRDRTTTKTSFSSCHALANQTKSFCGLKWQLRTSIGRIDAKLIPGNFWKNLAPPLRKWWR